jgi:hypothetical protein
LSSVQQQQQLPAAAACAIAVAASGISGCSRSWNELLPNQIQSIEETKLESLQSLKCIQVTVTCLLPKRGHLIRKQIKLTVQQGCKRLQQNPASFEQGSNNSSDRTAYNM